MPTRPAGDRRQPLGCSRYELDIPPSDRPDVKSSVRLELCVAPWESVPPLPRFLLALAGPYPWRLEPDAEQVRARRDEQRAIIRTPEGEVGRTDARTWFAGGLRQVQSSERHAHG